MMSKEDVNVSITHSQLDSETLTKANYSSRRTRVAWWLQLYLVCHKQVGVVCIVWVATAGWSKESRDRLIP